MTTQVGPILFTPRHGVNGLTVTIGPGRKALDRVGPEPTHVPEEQLAPAMVAMTSEPGDPVITLSGDWSMTESDPGWPAFSGNPTIEIEITTSGVLGVAQFRWRNVFKSSTRAWSTSVLTGTSVDLPVPGGESPVGVAALFAAGTYTIGHVYRSQREAEPRPPAKTLEQLKADWAERRSGVDRVFFDAVFSDGTRREEFSLDTGVPMPTSELVTAQWPAFDARAGRPSDGIYAIT